MVSGVITDIFLNTLSKHYSMEVFCTYIHIWESVLLLMFHRSTALCQADALLHVGGGGGHQASASSFSVLPLTYSTSAA